MSFTDGIVPMTAHDMLSNWFSVGASAGISQTTMSLHQHKVALQTRGRRMENKRER